MRQEKEEKQRVEEENKNKLIGDATMKIKKGYNSPTTYGVDRYTDIREGEAVKKGIIDQDKKTK